VTADAVRDRHEVRPDGECNPLSTAKTWAAAPAGGVVRHLVWLTDLHLNFVTSRAIDDLCAAALDTGANVVLLGGDIGEAPDVVAKLKTLDRLLG
jgi:hypothetical protein